MGNFLRILPKNLSKKVVACPAKNIFRLKEAHSVVIHHPNWVGGSGPCRKKAGCFFGSRIHSKNLFSEHSIVAPPPDGVDGNTLPMVWNGLKQGCLSGPLNEKEVVQSASPGRRRRRHLITFKNVPRKAPFWPIFPCSSKMALYFRMVKNIIFRPFWRNAINGGAGAKK